MADHRRSAARCSVFVLAGLALLGCAAPRTAAPVEPAPPPPDAPLRTPIVPAAAIGVEVIWWLTDDTDRAATAALSEAVGPVAKPLLRPEADRAWRSSGFRLVRAPRSSVRALVDAASPIVATQRRWLGSPRAWAPVLEGRSVVAPRDVVLLGARSRLEPGALRVIGRAWDMPGPDGPSLRLDLAVQHVPDAREASGLTVDPSSALDLWSAGRVPAGLHAEFTLARGEVALLVPEIPAVSWRGSGPARADRGPARSQAPEQTREAGVPAGPASRRLPTLAEQMLAASTSRSYAAPSRAVAVIVPWLPDRATLIED